ncbi:hypothetical protein ACQ4PT_057220 [Festuca glaucescens]
MSAVVYCGKRSSSIFADELLPPLPFLAPPQRPGAQALPLLPAPAPPPGRAPAPAPGCLPRHGSPVEAYKLPQSEFRLLERALEASGDDLDSAIKSLKELNLESTQAVLSATASENGQPTAVQPSVEGIVTNGGLDTATEHQPAADSHQATNSGPEWVELFVREMSNASDMDDARARASRALEALTKSIVDGAGAAAAQSLHQENMLLKEQMTAVLSQNAVLKRAVAIQHERQKEYDERSNEVQGLKQLVLQYQEQLRTLEINNYALQMHLKQAQQSNSMPGRYNPDPQNRSDGHDRAGVGSHGTAAVSCKASCPYPAAARDSRYKRTPALIRSNHTVRHCSPHRRKPRRPKPYLATHPPPLHIMTAAVADRRKRRAGAFLEDPSAVLPQLLAKRGRCSPTSAARAVEDLGISLEYDPLDALQLIFPDADPQLLRGYFEASGNVLDAAIRGFKDHLASGSETASAGAASSRAASGGPELNTPTNGTEWAELIVKEMLSASDMIDAKNRAFRILELLEKSTSRCITPDEQKMHEEHKILKQMLLTLVPQNSILKRGFLIQHSRLKDYHDMVQERSQFKEIVDKYQNQIKALEDRNYVLSFHLAQLKNSTSGHRNPDVF